VDQVFPDHSPDVDAAALYRDDHRSPRRDRPWVAMNMVASLDGAVTIDGLSGGLSGPADKAIFFALRSVADVVLVGAGTVRAENYGPPRITDEQQAARVARGQAPVPTIALVSGRLHLEPGARVFTDSPTRPVVLTTERAARDHGGQLADVADIVAAGEDEFDPGLALTALATRDAKVVVCEGGPTLNGGLLAAGLVDELCVTVAPLLVGGEDPRIIRGRLAVPPRPIDVDRILTEDGFLFVRALVRD
jgi:riboflavin-specific deaminase-like protein